MATRDQIYDAIRNADKAGDSAAVQKLGAYLATMDQPAEVQPVKPRVSYNATDKAASFFTGGLSDKVGALGAAIGGEIRERMVPGSQRKAFADRYTDDLAATDAAETQFNEQNPATRVALAPLAIVGAAPSRAAAMVAPTLQMAARAGGVLGAATGAGSSRGTVGEQAATTALSAAGGAVLGPLVQMGANRLAVGLANRAAARAANPDIARRAAVMGAAGRQGIAVLPADVGSPLVRGATATLSQSALASGSIRNGAEASLNSSEAALNRVAGQMGQPLDNAGLGARAQQGANAFVERSRDVGGRLYTRAETLAGNATVTATNALNAMDTSLAELGQNPATNRAAIDALSQIRDDLAMGAKPLSAVRDLRTQVRDAFANQGLRGNDLNRRVGGVLDALNDDITRSLAGNPQAVAAYRRADGFWRNRVETIDQALVKILGNGGNVSAEQAAQRLVSMTSPRGDSANLTRILRSLPGDARGDVAASLVARLGRSSAGGQNAAGDAFSAATFGTNWNNLTPQARGALFPNAAHRADLDDIATVLIDGTKAASRYANSSNTGGVVMNTGTAAAVGGGIMAAGMGNFAPLFVATTAAIGQTAGGRLLGNPAFARWFAPTLRAPNMAAINARLSILPRLAASNPTIRTEINAFVRAANDNAARVAAQGDGGVNQQPQAE
jgi:hypothetical protein